MNKILKCFGCFFMVRNFNKIIFFSSCATLFVIAVTLSPDSIAKSSKVYSIDKAWTGLVTRYGAVPDDGLSDAEAFQKAIDAFKAGEISEVIIPPGDYIIDRALEYKTIGYARGLTIKGAGINSTNILYSSSNGKAFLTIDGASERPYQFQQGGVVSGLSIRGLGKGLKTQGPVFEIVGWWQGVITGNKIQHVDCNSAVILFPLKEDVDKNPDAYSSVLFEISKNEISFNRCAAIYGESGVGFNGLIERNRIGENAGGGIVVGGHFNEIKYNSIFSNGFDSDRGGVFLKKIQASTNVSQIIERNEFDTNNNYHVLIEAGVNTKVSFNRFISRVKDNELVPKKQVEFKTNMSQVRNTVIENNYHRTHKNGRREVFLYRFNNDPNVVGVEMGENFIPKSDNTSNFIELHETKGLQGFRVK